MKKQDNYPFTTTTVMHVSGLIHRNGGKSVCVMIDDKEKSLEVRIPEDEILMKQGYSDEETHALIEYLHEISDEIISTAKNVNPMKAFMS